MKKYQSQYWMSITAYVNSDHAHDKATRRSITGLIIIVGRTPVLYFSKRQGAIETSTYGAEFIAMKTAVEEVISVRYMRRCLGVKVSKPSPILGDNRSIILNSTIPSSLLMQHCILSQKIVTIHSLSVISTPKSLHLPLLLLQIQ